MTPLIVLLETIPGLLRHPDSPLTSLTVTRTRLRGADGPPGVLQTLPLLGPETPIHLLPPGLLPILGLLLGLMTVGLPLLLGILILLAILLVDLLPMGLLVPLVDLLPPPDPLMLKPGVLQPLLTLLVVVTTILLGVLTRPLSSVLVIVPSLLRRPIGPLIPLSLLLKQTLHYMRNIQTA